MFDNQNSYHHTMKWSLQTILQRFQGTLLNGSYETMCAQYVDHLCTLEEGNVGGLSFFYQPKYLKQLYQTKASAILVPKNFTLIQPIEPILISVAHPYNCFISLMEEVSHQRRGVRSGVESPSYIGQEVSVGVNLYRGAFSYIGNHVVIGDNVKIYPHVYVGNHVTIGDNSILYSGSKLGDHTVIGQRCVIHAGAIIGSQGFGFITHQDHSYQRIPSIGSVVLENDVEIGTNTTIDAATIGKTHIGTGTKIDNLVHIAHNVEIGKHTGIAAQVGIAGSTKVGSYCRLGGQVGIAGHIQLGDGLTALGKAGITRSFKEGYVTLSGTPAFENRKFLACYAWFKKLGQEMKKKKET